MRRLVSITSVAVTLAVLVVILVTATLVDRRPPRVERVVLSPAAGAPDRAQALSVIQVEFDEPVDHASVEGRLRIRPSITGSISWNGSTATFTPAARLPASTTFSVTIEPGFTDLAGNAAPAGLEDWTFSTAATAVARASRATRR
jgi:hypothetical protein